MASGATTIRAFIRAIRVHQWVKNLLLFVPVVTAHHFFDPVIITRALWAFVAMSLTSSAIYLLNDVIDLESDKLHPEKRHRPFVSGTLPVWTAFIAMPLFLACAMFIAHSLGRTTSSVIAVYFALALLYSVFLKRYVLIDIFFLAAFYSLRIFLGGVATGIPLSEWLLAFSGFIFLSLAAMKRYIELQGLKERSGEKTAGRGYRVEDLPFVENFGTTAGYLSVLVFALYMTSAEVKALYALPALLWFNAIIVFYWIGRVWLLARRGEVHDDPIIFALKDNVSYGLGLLAFFVILLSI